MKISLAGFLKFKPFDEASDGVDYEERYANSRALSIGIVLSFSVAFVGLLLAIIGHEAAIDTVLIAVGISAVVSGMEWHSGLRARALNQLFVTVLCVVGTLTIVL